YTWTHFLRSKDETPEVLIDFLRLVQRGLQAQVRVNGVVERRKHTLVEAAQRMLSAAKVPLFFWAEAIATACFTQNRSLVIPRHEKTPYHIINERKPSVKFFRIFGSVCYIVRDGENLDKMKEKGDECIFVGYSTQSRAYRVYNKRTRVIMESIHVNFDELLQMASVQNSSDPAPTRQSMASAHNSSNPAPICQKMASVQISSDPAPECQTMVLEHSSLSPGRNCLENVSHGDKTDTMSNELDLLFSPMFDELLNGSSKVVSKSSAVTAADAPNQRHQPTTPLNNHTTHAPTCQTPPITPSVISSENINQAKPHAENDEVADDEFINIFSTPVQDKGETSSRHVDSSNMHTFYQRYPSEQRWTKDHPLEQVIGNPLQSVRTIRQLESDAEMCMFALIEKGDEYIFVGYSTQSRAYRVFNKRTRVIMESIHVNFDELPQMASAHNSSDPAPTCQTMASVQISSDLASKCQTMTLEHNSLSPGRICQENVSHGDKTGTTSNELDLLFSPMFDELLNGSTKVVSKSSAVSAADAPNQRQQPTTPLNNHTTPVPTCQNPSIASTVRSSENINQAASHAKNDQVTDDEFINIFSTPVQDQGETSSRYVDSSNMHTFYQRYPSE
nr:retrovirus-related Pol polyprotein from transposon TNT 1-94 [Tanacetum cinerariifolium]